MKKMPRSEIGDNELGNVSGGDGAVKGENQGTPIPWICPFCGSTVMVRSFQDGKKHLTNCPQSPYK